MSDIACLQYDEVRCIGNYWRMLSNIDFSVYDIFIDKWDKTDLLYGFSCDP